MKEKMVDSSDYRSTINYFPYSVTCREMYLLFLHLIIIPYLLSMLAFSPYQTLSTSVFVCILILSPASFDFPNASSRNLWGLWNMSQSPLLSPSLFFSIGIDFQSFSKSLWFPVHPHSRFSSF